MIVSIVIISVKSSTRYRCWRRGCCWILPGWLLQDDIRLLSARVVARMLLWEYKSSFLYKLYSVRKMASAPDGPSSSKEADRRNRVLLLVNITVGFVFRYRISLTPLRCVCIGNMTHFKWLIAILKSWTDYLFKDL